MGGFNFDLLIFVVGLFVTILAIVGIYFTKREFERDNPGS
jgi:hypothetical protein